MARIAKSFLSATILASIAVAPVSAQANTRAGDNAMVYDAPVSQPGQGRSIEGENISGGFGEFIAGLFVGLWTAGILTVAFDDDDSRQSPGT